jgi:molybdate transport system ATP-binding protein
MISSCQTALVRLVHLEQVNVSLAGRRVLNGVSFGLETHQVWWVRGPNGAGKSTFLRLVRGEVWPDPGVGSRWFTVASDQARESPIGVRERVAFVSPEMQDRYARLELPVTGLEVVQTGFHQTDLLSYPLEPSERERVQHLVHELRLEALMTRPVTQLSKGQLRQVLLARALVGQPSILMLDEFFSGVDAASRTRLTEMVEHVARSGAPILYTTHRSEEVLACTTHTLEIKHGQVTHQGRLEADPNATFLTQERRVARSRSPARAGRNNAILELQDVNVFLGSPSDDATALDGSSDGGYAHVLHNIHWVVQPGQHWVVVGHNGAGKSTLMRLLRGELNPAVGGSIRRFGLERMPLWEIQRRVGLVSNEVQVQHRVDAPGWVIVASGFGASVGWVRDLQPTERERVSELLDTFEVDHLADRSALETSNGELKKLLIARALVTTPEVVILDEPFDDLDTRSRALLFRLVERESTHSSLIVIAHRAADVPPSVTHLLALEMGRVRFQGEVHTPEAQAWLDQLEADATPTSMGRSEIGR